MSNLDFTQLEIKQLITHHIGNKLRDEKFQLSNEESILSDETRKFLLKYFLLPIKADEFFSFHHSVNIEMNEIYKIIMDIFSNYSLFIESSKNIAKLLYEKSMHPKIKDGELNIVYFSNVVLDDKIVDAIGIFKSETNVPYIKMKNQDKRFNINHDFGYDIKGIDKGCIIFDTDQNSGYKILIVDNLNKSIEAQYWKDNFLEVQPIKDEYYHTQHLLSLCKSFVTKELPQQFDVSKADQVDLLNKSVQFFKDNESFDMANFTNEVISQPDMINSFNQYKSDFQKDREIAISDNFSISESALKKQVRSIKSIIKLDKNFHIYVHGDRNMIEQGIDEGGRKYYKIYYQEES